MNKLNIGIVIGTMQGGGAQRVVCVLGEYLIEHGYYVDIITTSDDELDYIIDSRIGYYTLNTDNNSMILKQISCFGRLYRHFKNKKYDIVLSFLPMTCVYVSICKLFGCSFKLIESERMDPNQDPQNKILRLIRNWAYSFADGLVMQTEDALHYFSKKIQAKSVIINNPINKNLPTMYEGEKDCVIVTAIRLEKQKNVQLLIDAFKLFHVEYDSYRLDIYGKGSQMDVLADKISEYGLKDSVHLKGFSKDVYDHIRKGRFFVLSSNYEGVSNSMLEALCMGVPVISTDHPIGGARMFIKDGENGYLTPVGDTMALNVAMRKIADMSEAKYRDMCTRAYKLRSELMPERVCKDWVEYIEHIIRS